MHTHPPQAQGDDAAYSFCPKCGAALVSRQLKTGDPERRVCSACRFVFFLDPKVATGCIAELRQGIILLRRSIEPGYGRWVFPGGYVDRGERVEDAAVREMEEESRLRVQLTSLLGVYSYVGRPVVVIVYTGTVVDGRLEAADESLEAACFVPDRIPWNELAFSSTWDALADYASGRHGVQRPDPATRPKVF
ncbi:MAG: NUDIX hydrolase [Candidatus Latescibacterota bacterium]|nr:MAG: NUDIX hydrolase [Candidatus Latescibacterota bacterium]